MNRENFVNIINKYGFLNIKPDPSINIIEDIDIMKKDKDAVILAHYYQ